ncbi:MAG: hypothetical protein M1834_004372 [Cirrosporium novae-zelandiae]|nr:MAG: hypothetical protein M1834_004372 [Cirrosporium novae-zelandiae]
MPSTKSILMAAAFAFSSIIDAHMIMKTPTPYGASSLDNSPLEADGSNFPCKYRGAETYDAEGANNVMPIGVNQTLSFTGTAVHGGGSCQISLTTTLNPKPKDDSVKWVVIHSIEGGCPANVPGNLDTSDLSALKEFQFSIPEGVSPGKYTLAWTWFNKVGNREMYMNCAPVTVTSGSSKRSEDSIKKYSKPGFTKWRRGSSFPQMFVANIAAGGGGSCTTVDSQNLKFPNPGDSVQYAGSSELVAPTGSCPTDADIELGSGSSSSSSSNSTSSSGSSGGSSYSVAASSAAATHSFHPHHSPGNFAPSATSSAAVAVSSSAVSVVVASSASRTASAALSTGTSTSGALSGSCSTEGEWNCIGGTSYQRCASGAWTAVEQMAAGTKCTSGLSTSLKMSASGKKKRNVRFSRDHVRRAHSKFGHW